MKILALDLATSTGVAYNETDGGPVIWAEWQLLKKKEIAAQAKIRLDRRSDQRIQNFFQMLTVQKMRCTPDIVVFEDVQFSSYTKQVQLWASFRCAVWICFPPEKFYIDCVPVGTLKLFATRNGAATKDAMARALAKVNPERFAWDAKYNFLFDRTASNAQLGEDAVDAIWLWMWARQNLARIGDKKTL